MSHPNLSADGTITFDAFIGRNYTFGFAGDFGGGSLAVNFVLDGVAAPFPNSPLNGPGTFTAVAPGSQIQLVLSGSTDPDIEFSIAPVNSETPAAIGAITPAEVDTKIESRIGGIDPTQINPGEITSVAFAGDSITARSTVASHSIHWTDLARVFAEKEITFISKGGGQDNFAASGDQSITWLNTHVPAVIAAAVKPSCLVTKIGTNDVANDIPSENYIANLSAGSNLLVAAGITPIFVTIPPHQPFNSVTANNGGGSVDLLNNSLYDFCRERGYLLIDCREAVENPETPGESYRGMFSEGDLQGLHPIGKYHIAVAAKVAEVLDKYGSGTSKFSPAGVTILTPNPTWATLPTITNGTSNIPIGTLTTVSRLDGVTGNILRLPQTRTTTKQIGSGDTGLVFTPVAPFGAYDFDVEVQRPNSFTSSTTNPVIAVVPIKGTTRKLVLIKPNTSGFTVTTTAQAVIDALNAHPEVSAMFTTASTGTPGSNVVDYGNTAASYTPIINMPPPGTAETAITSDTDEIRIVGEIWVPKGAYHLALPRIRAHPTYGAGAEADFVASVTSSDMAAIPLPHHRRLIIETKWKAAGDFRRFGYRLSPPNSDGITMIGRLEIQRRAAP